MYCKNCGNKIEDDSKYCVHCGNNIIPESTEISKPKSSSNKKKVIIISSCIIAVVAVISIIVTLVLLNRNIKLNENEQQVYENCKYLKSIMKNPDSFKLYDDSILFLKHYDEDGYQDFTYSVIKYGGTNGYGALTTSEAIFKDGRYIMDYEDDLDEDDYTYEEKRTIKLDLLDYKVSLELNGEEPDNLKLVDINFDKVMKKMKIK